MSPLCDRPTVVRLPSAPVRLIAPAPLSVRMPDVDVPRR
jgi:hypothetical protein